MDNLDNSFSNTNHHPATSPTYSDLLAHFDTTIAPSMSEGSAANMRSALNQYLNHFGRGMTDAIGTEFGAGFTDHLADFLENRKAAGSSDGTVANRKTDLKRWETICEHYLSISSTLQFETISDAIAYYYEAAHKKDPTLSKRKASTMAGWGPSKLDEIIETKAKTARTNSIKEYEALENVLGAPPASFTRFALQSRLGELNKNGRCTTEYGKRLQQLIKEPFRMKVFPAQLSKEIADHYNFKTIISPLPLKRNEKWRQKNISEFRSAPGDLPYCTSPDGTKFSETGNLFASSLRAFFGVLTHKGYDPDKFSLAYLAEPELLSIYLEFMVNRIGMLTTTATVLLTIAESLLFQNYGFLRQQSKFSSHLLTPVSGDTWDDECERRRKLILELHGNLNKDRQIKQGRDPFAHIKEYLDRQHPITALLEIGHNIRSYLKTNGRLLNKVNRLALERDALIFDILPIQPLRVRMFHIMTYLKDNSGNLYQRNNKTWAIRFKSEDFKNETGAAQKPYDVPLPDELQSKIDHYISEVRPLFNNDSPFVFVSYDMGSKPKDRGTSFIACTIASRSRQFLQGCKGFRPHSARHIVATDYIRNNPNGYQVAADVLHDRLETVLRHYAHLKAEDGHRHYQKYFLEVASAWRSTL